MNKADRYCLISPHYFSKKLEPPFYRDLVDVFEDRMRYWMLKPAEKLLNERTDKIAAVGILLNYFEGIEIYLSGKDSKNASFQFFQEGFKKVFGIDVSNSDNSISKSNIKEASRVLYTQARCGFAHDGLFRNNVLFGEISKNAILISWPKPDGKLLFDNGAESIVINPTRFYECIKYHFEQYLSQLKSQRDEVLVYSFKKAVSLKWGLEKEYRVIAMPKPEFISNSTAP